MKKTNFGSNIENFRYARDWSRRKFADALNDRMESYDEGKIYSANDIWTYEYRGSRPKDENAIMEICKILEKNYEDIISKEFTMEEFNPVKSIEKSSLVADEKWSSWNIDYLDECSDKEKEFIYALVSSLDWEMNNGKERGIAVMDVGVSYDGGRSVEAAIYYGEGEEDKLGKVWSWSEYGEIFKEIDSDIGAREWGENDIVGLNLDGEVIRKFEKMGLIFDFYVFECDKDDEYSDSRMDHTYIANIWLDINKQDVREILKRAVEFYKNKIIILEGEKYTKLVEVEGD